MLLMSFAIFFFCERFPSVPSRLDLFSFFFFFLLFFTEGNEDDTCAGNE